MCEPGGTKTLMRHPYLNKHHAPHVPSWPSPFAEPIALQHAWPRRPPLCRLCEHGDTKTLMRHPYLNKQHAPHVPSGPSPSTQPSSPPARLCPPVGWARKLSESIRFGTKIETILVTDHFEISGIEHGPPACLATATSKVQIVRAWRHENAYAPPLLE